jgi:hypothetical protein
MKTPDNFLDTILNIPKGIDLYIYSPGAGGEFFSSLISLSHKKTRSLLNESTFKGIKDSDENPNLMRYRKLSYFELKNSNIFGIFGIQNFENIIDSFYWFGHQLNGNEKINFLKAFLLQSMLTHSVNINKKNNSKKELSFNSIFSDTYIILCTHYIDLIKIKEKNINLRNFGIPLLEKEKSFNIINLDPQTKKGIDFVKIFCEKYELFPNAGYEIQERINHNAFKNIKLKFPFMDYMINNDFNSIKDYLENRYGTDLDYEFIDKALIDYKKLRIDPYL